MIKKAFTMAEAILVMTILGIIATIMIANIKPSEFREEAMQIQAKKLMNELDEVINQTIINDSEEGYFLAMRDPNNPTQICVSYSDNATAIECQARVFSKYVSGSRKPCNSAKCPCYDATNGIPGFYSKDGSCVTYQIGVNMDSFIPGDDAAIKIIRYMYYIFFDVNGEQGPNILGKDQYRIPLYSKGLWFDAEAVTGKPNGAQCGTSMNECASEYCKSKYQNKSVEVTGELWGVCASGS